MPENSITPQRSAQPVQQRPSAGIQPRTDPNSERLPTSYVAGFLNFFATQMKGKGISGELFLQESSFTVDKSAKETYGLRFGITLALRISGRDFSHPDDRATTAVQMKDVLSGCIEGTFGDDITITNFEFRGNGKLVLTATSHRMQIYKERTGTAEDQRLDSGEAAPTANHGQSNLPEPSYSTRSYRMLDTSWLIFLSREEFSRLNLPKVSLGSSAEQLRVSKPPAVASPESKPSISASKQTSVAEESRPSLPPGKRKR